MADFIAFARLVMQEWPETCGELDGCDLQDLAVECGLLLPETRTTPCCDDCFCAEYHGHDETLTCFRRCPELL